MKRWIALIVIYILSGTALAAEPVHFLALSDIHFDPYVSCKKTAKRPCPLITKLRQAPVSSWSTILAAADTSLSTYWEDSSYRLLQSALNAAGQAAEKQEAKFVLMLGDALAHQYREQYRQFSGDRSRAGAHQFINKTFQFLTNEYAKTFPGISVYSVLGNNDAYGGNYYSWPGSQFYSDIMSVWSRTLKDKSQYQSMQKTFRNVGYYAVNLPEAEGLRLIMMNTVLFSNKALGKNIDEAVEKEFAWLHQELQAAREKGQRVLIAMHIPQGIDVLSLFKLPIPLMSDLWKEDYMKRFDEEIKAFAPEIVGIMSGHVHAGSYQILRFNDLSTIPWIGVPSISPVYGNHPTFKAYSYSPDTHHLTEIHSYYFSMRPSDTWQVAFAKHLI